jgi:uncharacterized protein with HEPN domain
MQQHLRNDLLYLLRILEAIEKIGIYTQPFPEAMELFEANDGKELNASLMLLTQIGEQAAKISNELKTSYPQVNWREVKDFRNRVVHDYTGLDLFISFDIIKQHVPLLKPLISNIVFRELVAGNFDKEEFSVARTSPYLRHVDFDAILTIENEL